MTLTDLIVRVLAAKLAQLRGTRASFTIEVTDAYFQGASYDGDDVLIEISAERFLPRALPVGSDERLLRLGFTRPSQTMPNWWIGVEGGADAELSAAASATVRALLEVYGVEPSVLAHAVGLTPAEVAAATLLAQAERLATSAHEGQFDKAGRPYIEHPRRVANRVWDVDGRPAAVCVAWLHDVVEDTDVTLDDLREAGFDDAIVAAVDALTRRDGEGDAYYRRVAASELAMVVKRADIWDNTNADRLAALSAAQRHRLQAKYAHALEVLARLSPAPIDRTPLLDGACGDLWRVDLRDRTVNGVRTHLEARLKPDGSFVVEGHDLGVPAGLVGNDDEYEYFYAIRPEHLPSLVELLGGAPDEHLRDVLANYLDDRSFELEKLLRTAPFPVQFHSC